MKNVFWNLFGCLLLVGCTQVSSDLAVPGVSKKLAEHRKITVSDLKYDLKFVIPGHRNNPVEGEVGISFRLPQKEDVILDFREDAEKIREVKVNGVSSAYRFENEHLLIPAQETVAGENRLSIIFRAGDQSLNRNEDYLYTLLVPDRARTLFPCFDQPDLKARFTLSLEVPSGWEAVSNAPLKESMEKNGRMKIVFAETEPLSTYLFSFVTGNFQRESFAEEGRHISIYHRETELQKQKQLPEIARQVFAALKWMEAYTAIPYPFAKYDLVILPGFQFGGMEHTGATLYNDKRMFLPEHPTVNEELGRAELIAHETAHMWFGDYVTMKWFDDVWTKEVFANYFAARMVEPLFPAVNHKLSALKGFYPAAYSEDRTAGSNAIKQELGNLNNAGLIYGQIVYNKAPVVMQMLVERMGEERFREGIRNYLKSYAYSNADWGNLIEILDRYTPEDLTTWSRVWVNEKGMPEIAVKREKEQVWLMQKDPFGRDICWPQHVGILLVKGDSSRILDVNLNEQMTKLSGVDDVDYILPGYAGKGYGYFRPDTATLKWCLGHIREFTDPLARMSAVMILNENRIQGQVQPADFLNALLTCLPFEENPLLYSSLVSYVVSTVRNSVVSEKDIRRTEEVLLGLSRKGEQGEQRLGAFRALLNIFRTPECTAEVYRIWEKQKPFEALLLSEADYRKMAYELAVRLPEKAREIIAVQENRITNPDRQREFQYIARAVNPEETVRDSLFRSLLKAENRRIEPWTCSVLRYLNHPLRQKQALKYIRPSLEILQEIQRTGDIFFPKNWVSSCLDGHRSIQAADSVRIFLEEHPDYPSLLKNKILQSADPLFRFANRQAN
ncbi:M1 family aminopeptidase [uncultured Culturomica sp.]|jgi:aminopeptidase N|uniref:M1 family metallopeptidase n=1 Tax=uncultured Culturomica sp. TaxID=1926654 RepID=UPI00033C9332|nr:M1 family aminopeptidase [uncultured Culturomica sp.]CCZ07914.1 putative uncharacterized protein [Odoribacter sp. CAG:788]